MRTRRGGLRGKLVSENGLFSSRESQVEASNGQDFRAMFEGCIGLWAAWCWLARRLHRLKASCALDFGTKIFLISCMTFGLEQLGLVDKHWLERDLSASLLKALAVGKRQQSESPGVDLDME